MGSEGGRGEGGSAAQDTPCPVGAGAAGQGRGNVQLRRGVRGAREGERATTVRGPRSKGGGACNYGAGVRGGGGVTSPDAGVREEGELHRPRSRSLPRATPSRSHAALSLPRAALSLATIVSSLFYINIFFNRNPNRMEYLINYNTFYLKKYLFKNNQSLSLAPIVSCILY